MSSPALQSLISQKDAIQSALDAQYGVLRSHGVTTDEPLVDKDGFPRADVDVYAVRHARVRIIELRNDLKAVMDDIARGLEGAFAARQAQEEPTKPQAEEAPFAKVDGVAPGSPAADAVRDLNYTRSAAC